MVQHGPHVGTNDIDKALRQAHDIDTQDTIHVDVLSPAMSDTVSDLYGFRLRHEHIFCDTPFVPSSRYGRPWDEYCPMIA